MKMFSKSFISILCIFIICDPFMQLYLVVAGGGKGFFAGGGNQEGDKALKSFEGGFGGGGKSGSSGRSKGEKSPPKYSHSTGMKAFDEIAYGIFPLGDKISGGLPDNPVAMVKYCAEFLPKGVPALIYTQARYPHKLLCKAMIVLVAIGMIRTTVVWCSNPISSLGFVSMAKIVNSANDELFKIREELITRILNTVTKIDNPDEKVKHACCAWIDYKRKSADAVPDEARNFVQTMIDGAFIMPQRLFCQDVQDESFEQQCGKLEFVDDDPDYPLTLRCMYSAPLYLVDQFI